MFSFLGSYYGVDILAMLMTFTGINLITKKKKIGFVVHAAANCVWFCLGIMAESWGLIVANVVFVFMNTRGYYYWNKESQ